LQMWIASQQWLTFFCQISMNSPTITTLSVCCYKVSLIRVGSGVLIDFKRHSILFRFKTFVNKILWNRIKRRIIKTKTILFKIFVANHLLIFKWKHHLLLVGKHLVYKVFVIYLKKSFSY